MIVEDEIQGSQTEDHESNDDNTDEVMSMFGIEAKQEEVKTDDKTPAKEDVKTDKAEPRMIKVKHNKEEIDVDVSDDKLPEYVQKSLALDKERDRKTELEKHLDRAAKLAGFDNHEDYITNLDKLEQDSQKQKEDEYTKLETDLIQEFEDAGGDPDRLKSWLENNPLLTKAKADIDDVKAKLDAETATKQQEAKNQQWQNMYKAYPELVESSQAFTKNEKPDWFNEKMEQLVNRGYDPKDAYELANRDSLTAKSKTKTEQRLIKEQQLGLRSQVETHSPSDNEPQVPEALANAFEAFGLPVESAKKYLKK